MSDTVTKLLALADALAQEAEDFRHIDTRPARQALQDELTRLLTPLKVVEIGMLMAKGNGLFLDHGPPFTAVEASRMVRVVRLIEAAHGIPGEIK